MAAAGVGADGRGLCATSRFKMVVLLRLRDVAGEARVEEVGQVCDLASILHIFAIDVVD